jgi:hypothetical protein
MIDFTKLLNRGHRYFIDKIVKKRKYGRCEWCDEYSLLIQYINATDNEIIMLVCEKCYNDMLIQEEK